MCKNIPGIFATETQSAQSNHLLIDEMLDLLYDKDLKGILDTGVNIVIFFI